MQFPCLQTCSPAELLSRQGRNTAAVLPLTHILHGVDLGMCVGLHDVGGRARARARARGGGGGGGAPGGPPPPPARARARAGAPGPRRAEEHVLHAGDEHRLALGALVGVALHHVAVLARVHLCAARRPASCAGSGARSRGPARATRTAVASSRPPACMPCGPRADLAVHRCLPSYHAAICLNMPQRLHTLLHHRASAQAMLPVFDERAQSARRRALRDPAQRTVGQVAAGRVAEARRVDDLAHEADALLRVRLLGAPLTVSLAMPPNRAACGGAACEAACWLGVVYDLQDAGPLR